jgi:hypothetical protein
MRLGFVVVAVALFVPGCKKSNATCDKFVERQMTCPDKEREAMSDSEKSQLKTLMTGMCEASFNEETAGADGETKKMMLEMYASMRKKAECVAKAADCEAAAACEKLD